MAFGGLDIGELFGRISLEDMFSGVLAKVEANVESFGEKANGFSTSLKEGIENPLGFAKEAGLEFLETIGPIGAVVGGAVVAVGALGVGMFELAENASQAGEEIERFEHITGMATEEVSKLKAVAEIGGSSLGQLSGMLFQTEKRLQAGGEAAEKVNRGLEDMKISAEEFRNASPEEKIRLLSEGLHNAQGSATMMADAMAVMGRGARENIPFLLKNFDEMEEKAERVAYIWSKEDVEAAEQFEQSTAALKLEVSNAAIAVGVALIPAMTGLVHVMQDVAEGFVAFSGIGTAMELFRELKGVLGEDELALQTQAALADMMAKRWADAAEGGMSLDAAAYKIAEDMLRAGYSIKTVAEQTGLAAPEVQKLKSEMDNASKAAIASGEAWDRINDAFSGFSDISPEVKGLVQDMMDAKVSVEDMALATGLSKEQVKALTEQLREGEKTAKEFNKAWEDLNTLGADAHATFAGIDKDLQDTVMYYAKAGASVKDLTNAFPGLTEAQAKAAESLAKQAEKESELWTKLGDLYTKSFEDKWALYATDDEKIVAKAEHDYEVRVKEAQDAGVIDEEYYNKLWDLRAKDISNAEEAAKKKAEIEIAQQLKTRDALNQVEAAIKQHMQVMDNATLQNNQNSQSQAKVVETIAQAWDLVGKGVSATTVKVKTLGGELISLEEAQKRFDLGNSITYDLSTQAGLDFYRKMNPGAQFLWSESQIIAAAKKGATLQMLINAGAINPFAGMGHAAMGGTIEVGENGPELVTLPVGSTVYPHGTAPAGMGGTLVMNFNVYGNTSQQVQQMKTILMRELMLHKQYSAAIF